MRRRSSHTLSTLARFVCPEFCISTYVPFAIRPPLFINALSFLSIRENELRMGGRLHERMSVRRRKTAHGIKHSWGFPKVVAVGVPVYGATVTALLKRLDSRLNCAFIAHYEACTTLKSMCGWISWGFHKELLGDCKVLGDTHVGPCWSFGQSWCTGPSKDPSDVELVVHKDREEREDGTDGRVAGSQAGNIAKSRLLRRCG